VEQKTGEEPDSRPPNRSRTGWLGAETLKKRKNRQGTDLPPASLCAPRHRLGRLGPTLPRADPRETAAANRGSATCPAGRSSRTRSGAAARMSGGQRCPATWRTREASSADARASPRRRLWPIPGCHVAVRLSPALLCAWRCSVGPIVTSVILSFSYFAHMNSDVGK
jgi:hypothetical protein